LSPYTSHASRWAWVSPVTQVDVNDDTAFRTACCCGVFGFVGMLAALKYAPPGPCDATMPPSFPLRSVPKTGLNSMSDLHVEAGSRKRPIAWHDAYHLGDYNQAATRANRKYNQAINKWQIAIAKVAKSSFRA
jgi:hypothetical protein